MVGELVFRNRKTSKKVSRANLSLKGKRMHDDLQRVLTDLTNLTDLWSFDEMYRAAEIMDQSVRLVNNADYNFFADFIQYMPMGY